MCDEKLLILISTEERDVKCATIPRAFLPIRMGVIRESKEAGGGRKGGSEVEAQFPSL